jgi:glycerol-3-phosphate cytidylyltransferase
VSILKKYKKGYLAGVFDLFHVGHLNLIRRAKDNCDYLIVGALADELVIKLKKNPPYISFEERKQILEAVRYVDEVVAVTEENHEKMKAWNLYHFDCLFSGDDYSGNPYWVEDQRSLQQVGSNIEFFPYTQSTSSTMIKAAISKTIQDNQNR